MRFLFSVFMATAIVFFCGCEETSSPKSPNEKSVTKGAQEIEKSKPTETSQKKETVPAKTVAKPTESPTKEKQKSMTLKAKFIEFSLGDASHFVFEDEQGKRWDFSGSKETSLKFEQALPASEANEENQGWGSNSKVQGKWFQLTYSQTQQELYIDGPIGTVYLIETAKLVQ